VLRATLKSLLGRKLRLFLTAISIVLGVGFVAGTYVLTDTMNAAFDQLFDQTASASDLVVRSQTAFQGGQNGPGGGGGGDERSPLDASLLSDVVAVPGVEIAVGDVQGYAQIVDPVTGDAIGGVGPPTIGTNWNELATGVLEIRGGRAPEAGGEVVVDAATARLHNLALGQTVSILFQDTVEEFHVVGSVGFGSADNLAGATLALFETSTAQRVLNKEGVYDAITVKAAAGANLDAVLSDVRAVLPEGVEAVSSQDVADEQAQTLQESLGFFRTALLVFAAVALFVGAFIIFNTFSIIVAQRTRELALLRTLGASRRQVMGSVVAEAVIVGLAASVIGIGAGIAIAAGLRGLLAAIGIDLPSTSTQLQARTIVASLLVGVGVTVVASVVPARHAAGVAPIEALREPDTLRTGGNLGRRAAVGAVAVAGGVALLLYGLFGNASDAALYVGGGVALTFVGIAVLSPLVARPVAGALGAPVRGLSVAAKIGRNNAMRNPRRTASTASALMIGLGLVAMVAILAASLKASFDAALSETLKADLTLSSSTFTPFSTDVANRVRALPEAGTVAAFRQNGFKVDGATSFMTSIEPDLVEQVAVLGVSQGSLTDLGGDTVAVHADLAAEKGWTIGSQVNAAFASTGDRPLTIVAVYDENGLAGDYAVATSTYEDLYVEQLDVFVLVKAAEGVSTDSLQQAASAAVAEFANVDVQDQAEFREKQAGFINQLLGLVTALLMMAIVIALFGIVNTLGLSIYERTRELGLLRAVGMERRQVKRMIRYESVIIALFGAVMGVVVGIGFGWALQQALEPEGVTKLEIPVGQLVVYFVFAAAAGLLAAIWPARRAAKLNVLESIAYE